MDQYNFSFSDSWSVGNDVANDVPCGESNSYVGRDYTAEFTTDQIFETRAIMLDWVWRVGKENGFVIVISKSASIKGNKMPKCILICERGGLYKPPPEGHSMQRITRTKKCDCPFKLRGVAQPPDGVMWGLKIVRGFHNHEPTESFKDMSTRQVIIDATYKSNEYRIPLLKVVGITSTMKTYSLIFAYLSNETKEQLIWALDTLKRWMVEKGAVLPSVVVSYRDLALLGAIGICFPFAQHILCIWHIN
ncbi:uncharacterized protein LOC131327607 [Rhododendron vialii]|uniref:uncharacterized protein LOC131327607 n=1 Tax=Rhododendron vialii TaxID=182163 RepID=UPI00265E2436|nr:uncharacterized protein LOC131327607 [Rhododendron vialii]